MDYYEFRQEIENRKPRYSTRYTSLIDLISNKGSNKGGRYIQFGPYYQTYIYATILGYHLGECNLLNKSDKSTNFAAISTWKPRELVDFILMLILSEEKNILGFEWIELDSCNDERKSEIISIIINRIEGYANSGFDYLQKIYEVDKDQFLDPFVFVNLLKNVIKK